MLNILQKLKNKINKLKGFYDLEFGYLHPDKFQEYSDQLADFLGIDEVKLSENSINKMKEMELMAHDYGQICCQHAMFLFLFGSLISAKNVVEIGTGSGMSGLTLSNALSFQKNTENKEVINFHTIDLNMRRSLEPDKNIGYLLENWSEHEKVKVSLHREKTSFIISDILKPKSVGLAFIDGSHEHPWPLQDLLNLFPVLTDNAVIILHDIDLPETVNNMKKENPAFKGRPAYGAKYIFDNWPGLRIRMIKKNKNIGAVVLPKDRKILKKYISKLMHKKFETHKDEWQNQIRHLEQSFDIAFKN